MRYYSRKLFYVHFKKNGYYTSINGKSIKEVKEKIMGLYNDIQHPIEFIISKISKNQKRWLLQDTFIKGVKI